VVFGWLLASLVGALPFYLSGVIPHYADAYFETMSGFTTTGPPPGLPFWRRLRHCPGRFSTGAP